jgi:hypothetical protein
MPYFVEEDACDFGDLGNAALGRWLVVPEHLHPEGRPMETGTRHLPGRHGLDDVVDMTRHSSRMGPQAGVDLVGVDQQGRDSGSEPRQSAELSDFRVVQVRDCGHMALGLHDECAEPERADAVFDHPAGSSVESSPG